MHSIPLLSHTCARNDALISCALLPKPVTPSPSIVQHAPALKLRRCPFAAPSGRRLQQGPDREGGESSGERHGTVPCCPSHQ